jgi:hypothetical protein
MINVDKEQTVVEFGFGDVGMTSGTSRASDGRTQGILGLRDIQMGACGTPVAVDKNVPAGKFPVLLNFNNINSIDALILSLERIKKLLIGGVC